MIKVCEYCGSKFATLENKQHVCHECKRKLRYYSVYELMKDISREAKKKAAENQK